MPTRVHNYSTRIVKRYGGILIIFHVESRESAYGNTHIVYYEALRDSHYKIRISLRIYHRSLYEETAAQAKSVTEVRAKERL